MRPHIVLTVFVAVILFVAMIGVGGFAIYQWDVAENAKNDFIAQQKKKSQANENQVSEYEKKIAENLEKSRLVQERKRTEEAEKNRLAQEKGDREEQAKQLEEKLKKLKMEEDALRLGSLSKTELRAAQNALARIKAAGESGFERWPSSMVQQAALIDPEYIYEMQRKLGEKRLKMKK